MHNGEAATFGSKSLSELLAEDPSSSFSRFSDRVKLQSQQRSSLQDFQSLHDEFLKHLAQTLRQFGGGKNTMETALTDPHLNPLPEGEEAYSVFDLHLGR